MAAIKSFGERIADALIQDGLLTAQQVEELLEQQKKVGARFIKLVLEKAYVSEQDLTVSMGRVLNVPPINLSRITVPRCFGSPTAFSELLASRGRSAAAQWAAFGCGAAGAFC